MRGHTIDFVRNPYAVRPPPGRAEWLDGEVANTEALAAAVRRCEIALQRPERTSEAQRHADREADPREPPH